MRKDVTDAIQILLQGGVVLFPTETAYGLAADAMNAAALRRVSEIKGREPGKTPPLVVANLAMAEAYVVIPDVIRPLAKKHWPGPLTVVGKVGRALASGAVRADGTVAVRVSSHPVARALAAGLGRPVTATSANVSGLSTCYSVRTFLRQVRAAGHREPDFIIDVGPIPHRKPSTIVTAKKGRVVVVREGSVKIQNAK